MSMWEPFREPARRTMVVAQEIAKRLGVRELDAEHIVAATVEVGDNLAADAFSSCGVGVERMNEAASRALPHGEEAGQQEMLFTKRSKQLIKRAFDEARNLKHSYIGTEHFLLAYITEFGAKSKLFAELGIERDALRTKLLQLIREQG